VLTDLLAALALVFVLEGLLPFLSPGKWRDTVLSVVKFSDTQLRGIGLASMLAGVVLLYLVR